MKPPLSPLIFSIIQYILGGLKYISFGSMKIYIFELEDVKEPLKSLLWSINKASGPGFFVYLEYSQINQSMHLVIPIL